MSDSSVNMEEGSSNPQSSDTVPMEISSVGNGTTTTDSVSTTDSVASSEAPAAPSEEAPTAMDTTTTESSSGGSGGSSSGGGAGEASSQEPTASSSASNEQESQQKIQNQQRLAEIQNILSNKDSLMEPKILTHIKQYIRLGGKPAEVLSLISSSYKGYAEMVNLVVDWLELVGMSTDDVIDIIQAHIKDLIIQRFDPKKADNIFQEGPSAPEWLEKMIQDPVWRSLIYNLSEEHKDCLVLNFAIQRISAAGFHSEIAALANASTFIDVFNRVFKDSLKKVLQADEYSLSSYLPDFKKMCNHSQHTYFYSQTLLHKLSKENTGNAHNLRRLMQELESSVVEKGGLGRRVLFLLSGINKHPEIATSILSMLTSKYINSPDIIKLYNVFSKPDPPSVEYLRHPELLDLIIRDLFNPHKNINPLQKNKYLYILAYATSKQNTDSTELPHSKNSAAFDETLKALEVVQPICQKNSFGSELQNAVPTIKEHLIHPVVSMGVIHWIRLNLTDPGYHRSSYSTLCTPIYLYLLRELCTRHHLQHATVLELLVQCFELNVELDPLDAVEWKKNLLNCMLFLVQFGHILPVLSHINTWNSTTDQSLIRHFITQLLDLIEGPYSDEFVNALLQIIGAPATVEALKSVTNRDLLIAFFDECIKTSKGNQQEVKKLHAIFKTK